MTTRHNALQSRLVDQYKDLPSRLCSYCESRIDFPRGLVKRESSYISPSGISFRPDISVWSNGALLATIEVVDTNLSDLALKAQAEIPNAFYFHVDGRFWCSPECWEWQHGRGPGSAEVSESRSGRKPEPLERVCALPQCEYCARLFIETNYPAIQVEDWELNNGPICIECAVQRFEGAQYKSPSECMNGITTPEGDDDVFGHFLALCDAVFWARVWHDRAGETNEAWGDESPTAKRLDDIEKAFDECEWNRGAKLLSAIGAPQWSMDRDNESPFYAWDPDNCRRTAEAWIRLREWRVKQLPVDLQKLVQLPDLATAPERKSIPEVAAHPPTADVDTPTERYGLRKELSYEQEGKEWERLNAWVQERTE